MPITKSLLKDLKTLQQRLSQHEMVPNSATESLEQLAKYANLASAITKTPDTETSLNYLLSQLLSHLLVSLKHLNLDFEVLVSQSLAALSESKNETSNPQNRIILVYANHADLLLEGEVRGSIPVYDRCDQEELHAIAKLFQCDLKFAESEQLEIFSIEASTSNKTTPIHLEELSETLADKHISNEISQLSLLSFFNGEVKAS